MSEEQPTLSEVVAYLLGEGPLKGQWFGDPRPIGERGAFWWRKYLRAAMSPLPDAGGVVEHAQGIAWFEQTFGVPLGDMPGRLEVERVRALASLQQEQNPS